MSELILYTSDDGKIRLDLRVDCQTVWLTQLEIAELFQTTKQNISLHAKNIFEDSELNEQSVVKDSLTVQNEGERSQAERKWGVKLRMKNEESGIQIGTGDGQGLEGDSHQTGNGT